MSTFFQDIGVKIKHWGQVTLALCFAVICYSGVKHIYLAYQVNVNGYGVFWANPTLETQIAMLDPEPIKKGKK